MDRPESAVILRDLWVAGLVIVSGVASANAADVMRENQVTESALIDALTPPSAPGKTRSIRLGRVDDPSRPPPRPRTNTTPSASLLITFKTNSTTLAPEARQALDVVARALKSERLAEFDFSIEGHADPRGNAEANARLSQERADAVRRYLVDAHGIEQMRLKSIGKGDLEPLNRADPAAPENRRVTFVTLSE